jgi:DNA-binding LacI/PurR family transcriptional regulator
MENQKPTLQQIADEAGVSATTASLYINGKAEKYRISQKTCSKIEQVIKKYNFKPNIHAKAIAEKKTLLIGVIVGDLNSSFWTKIITGIQQVIEAHDYHLILTTTKGKTSEDIRAFKNLIEKGVDGFIYSPQYFNAEKDIDKIIRTANKIPVVTLNVPVKKSYSVLNDNETGGKLAAQCFIENGHTDLAYIGSLKCFDKRAGAFRKEAESKGAKVKTFNSCQQFIEKRGKQTAVFCFSDYVLMNLYGLAASRGIKIPEDLSAIGYDNMDFINLLTPKPVSIHQYKNELGQKAAEMLMELISGEKLGKKEFAFTPHLTDGKSVIKV